MLVVCWLVMFGEGVDNWIPAEQKKIIVLELQKYIFSPVYHFSALVVELIFILVTTFNIGGNLELKKKDVHRTSVITF